MSFKFGKLALYLELIVKVKSSLFFVNRPVNKLRVYQPFDFRAGLDRRHDAVFRLWKMKSMTISEESKMSVECFFGFELGLVRTFVAIFEFAMISLHQFFGIANAMFVLLSDHFLH